MVSVNSTSGLVASTVVASPTLMPVATTFMLSTLYISGGTMAENSPVSESVRIKIFLAASPAPRHEWLAMVLVADCTVALAVLVS